jgi:fucose permease
MVTDPKTKAAEMRRTRRVSSWHFFLEHVTMSHVNFLTAMMVAALLVGGMGVAILGSIKVPLAARLQMDEARVGGLVSIFGFTLIPVIFIAGFLTDLAGKQAVLMAGCACMFLGLGELGVAKRYVTALGGIVLFSAGWSLLTNVGNVLTPIAFGGDTAYATNLANVFFGLGAFLTPLLVTVLLRRLTFVWTMLITGGLVMIPFLLALRVDFSTFAPPATAASEIGLVTLLAAPMLWLCGMGLFFYGPMEASLAAWATTYLQEQHVKDTTAAGFLSGFWLTFMMARLATAFLLPKGFEAHLILALALASALVLGLMVVSRSRALAMALVPAAGVVFGPIFPTLIAVLLDSFAPEVRGRAVGLFFAIGGVGWTMIPILIGKYAQRTSLQRALSITVAAAAGLSCVAVVMLL